MTLRIAIPSALALALSTALATTAFAQSYNAPAGIPAATAPGGLEGRAAVSNLVDARDGAAGYAPRGYSDDALVTGSLRGPRGEVVRRRD